eukprot:TRINITY_DN1687_c0_g1_i1.p1 TRINITY_DN1687_c0_g1~~TRINITY_DN1687_c0_g1_i1.p1  ORF type:complete len:109 (+),score=4.90 TRINITY_DN1687_c0_g1_i1:218-544(+)
MVLSPGVMSMRVTGPGTMTTFLQVTKSFCVHWSNAIRVRLSLRILRFNLTGIATVKDPLTEIRKAANWTLGWKLTPNLSNVLICSALPPLNFKQAKRRAGVGNRVGST